jgi:hypothetical protein
MNAYQMLINDVAEEQIRCEWPQSVTADAVRKHITPDVVADWIASETEGRDDMTPYVLVNLISYMTPGEVFSVLCGIANRNPSAQVLLQESLIDRVALDVSFEAQKLVDNAEPTDSYDLGDYADSRHDEQVQDRLDGLQ